MVATVTRSLYFISAPPPRSHTQVSAVFQRAHHHRSLLDPLQGHGATLTLFGSDVLHQQPPTATCLRLHGHGRLWFLRLLRKVHLPLDLLIHVYSLFCTSITVCPTLPYPNPGSAPSLGRSRTRTVRTAELIIWTKLPP